MRFNHEGIDKASAFDKVPDGTYLAQYTGAEAFAGQGSEPNIRFGFVIQDVIDAEPMAHGLSAVGMPVSEVVWGPKDPEGYARWDKNTKRMTQALGCAEDSKGWDDTEVVGKLFQITLVTKNEYQNIKKILAK